MIKVIAAHKSHFDAFRRELLYGRDNKNSAAAQQLRYVKNHEDIRDGDRVILVGPFWAGPEWNGMLAKIIEKTKGANVAFEWFPHSRGSLNSSPS